LLAEAGFPEGRGFPKLGIAYNTNDAHKKLAEVVADQLRRNLGIEVVPYNQEWQAFLVTVRSKQYDIARAGWNGDYADPNTFLDMWVTNGSNNQTGFSSDTYDTLIRTAGNVELYLQNPTALAGRLKDPTRIAELAERSARGAIPSERVQAQRDLRFALLREAEAILVQDQFPIIPVYFYVVGNLVSPKVKGLYTQLQMADGTTPPNLLDLHPLRDVQVVAPSGGR
jgi:oligopeptide transport system substrate-binding protein